MQTKKLHNWNLSYREAVDLQKKLACRVCLTPLKKVPRLIAGVDCALAKDGNMIIAGVVVLSWPAFDVVETKHAIRKLAMPYIPGLLSFREAPVCIAAVEKLGSSPDLFIIDGQGIAHPRRLGLAAHLGMFFDKPTIGCAKSRLTGVFKEPPAQKGSFSLLKDTDETIGAVVRTRDHVKCVFISVGNKCTLEDAVKWTVNCAVKYRLPEPTRQADKFVARLSRSKKLSAEQ